MKTRLFVFAVICLAATVLFSCTPSLEPAAPTTMAGLTVKASLEPEIDSRLYADEQYKLHWTSGDCISVFAKDATNQRLLFTGSTGDTQGTFTGLGDTDNPQGSISHYVAVYPYDSKTSIDGNEVISVNLPSQQTYAAKSFGQGADIMVAVSETPEVAFKGACGMLVLKIFGNKKVSSITLTGNNGELLSGPASITMPLGGVPSLKMAGGAQTSVSLACENPVSVGETEQDYAEFWLVLPPVTFSKGFTVNVKTTEGITYKRVTEKSVSITRNHVTKMAPFPLIVIPDAIDLGLPSGLKWASFNVGATSYDEPGDYFAWGETWTKDDYVEENYSFYIPNDYGVTKYNPRNSGFGKVDNKSILEPVDDVAAKQYGGKWHMPTVDDFQELEDNCDWGLITYNGAKYIAVMGSNENYILLPLTEYYTMGSEQSPYNRVMLWTSNVYTVNPMNAYTAVLTKNNISSSMTERWWGIRIRAVCY